MPGPIFLLDAFTGHRQRGLAAPEIRSRSQTDLALGPG